jgi:hypothetical protein
MSKNEILVISFSKCLLSTIIIHFEEVSASDQFPLDRDLYFKIVFQYILPYTKIGKEGTYKI